MKPEEIEVGGWYWFEWGYGGTYLGVVLTTGESQAVFLVPSFIGDNVVTIYYHRIIGPGEPPKREQAKPGYEQELVEDMLTLMSSFSNKIYGKRSAENRKKKKQELQTAGTCQ